MKIEFFPLSHLLVYDPCKDNYTVATNCPTCRSAVAQKPPLDMHESVSISAHHPANAHSISAANSQSSQNTDEPPPHKLRIAHISGSTSTVPADVSHMEIEPKIDYDSAVPAGGIATDTEDSPPPPPLSKTAGFLDEEQQQSHHQPELHFERLQHEYFLQQQQQQHQQQQQQQHMEAIMQETAANSLRQRKDRMSKKQKDVYVNFLEQHPLINEHRRNDPALDRYWIKLADILNSVPQGAVKHVAEWKQTFDNWRYRVFLYARYNSKITGDEALNPKSFKPLTHTDKRAYHIWIRNPDTAPPDLDKMRNVFANLEETQQE